MNRILLTALASVALSFAVTPDAFGETHPQHNHDHAHHIEAGKTADEMAKECEERLGAIKDTGANLPAGQKAEFDYALEIAGIEVKALKDPSHGKDFKKHAHSCQRHLGNAEHIVKKHEKHVAHEKKMEERKAKAEERKAKAIARKTEREAAKAKREAEKAEKAAAHHAQHHGKENGLDHGVSDGASKEAPGADAEKPLK
ncbi:MAG: hypothetical protein K0R52_1332 [Alphaproteobacteria bacterium]|jgi:hypothetical protein|nr:hypothetical protein [Alphaproteobacteria bacterium]